MYKHILVAMDGSQRSERAMASALALAVQHSAELLALTVVPRRAMNYFTGMTVATPEDMASNEARDTQPARQALDALARQAQARAVSVKTDAVVSDTPASAIAVAAAKHGSDLIVMPSDGRGRLARLVFGGDTQQQLVHAGLPVLVV